MHVLKESFHGNPNVGLYGICTKKFLLLGPEVPKKLHADLAEAFKLEVKELTIAGSSLLGVFLAGNTKTMLVPAIAYPEELDKLKRWGIPFTVIDTKLTCFGNNTLVGEDFALLSPEFKEGEAKRIGEVLGVHFLQTKLADVDTVGSVAAMNAHGCLLHYEAKEHDLDLLRHHFKIAVEHGSVNLGNPYVKSGIIVNDHGFIIGGLSGGPEIVHADRTFGFVD
jgi:translation initiation factor 6